MNRIAIVSLLILALVVPARGQDPKREDGKNLDLPFDCVPSAILGATAGSVISGCADTIRLFFGKPLPGKTLQSPISAPVRLYRLAADAVNDVIEEEMGIHWQPDTASGAILVIPEPPLAITLEDPNTPIRYRLVADCRFWVDPDTAAADTSYLDFWKQHLVHVRGVARLVGSGQDITTSVVLQPVSDAPTVPVADGVQLIAENTERFQFQRWECSLPSVQIVESEPLQLATAACWPLLDTVTFTAWYQDRTSTVAADDHNAGIRVRTSHGAVRVWLREPSSSLRIAICDLAGRSVAYHEERQTVSEVSVNLPQAAGVYLMAVHTAGRTVLLPIIQSPLD